MNFFYLLSILGSFLTTLCTDTKKYENDPDWKTLKSLPEWFEKYEYKPEWKSLDKRPLPEWYDKAKIGILVHWGVFSVPSFQSEWFWYQWEKDSIIDEFMKFNYPPNFTYLDFGPMFQAEIYNPNSWAELFSRSGAKYVILTSKHHEGFTLYPSKRTLGWKWNAVEVGPKRDLIHPLAKAVRVKGLKFGLYHSLYEWYEPRYLEDKVNGFETQAFINSKLLPELRQIVLDYKPSIIWSDGDWEANDRYWRSKDFLAWLYSESPVKDEVVVNDRWGAGTNCRHGGFYTCAEVQDNETRKWENAFSLDKKSWGYRRDMRLEDVMTFPELLREVVSSVSRGGNALVNVGATMEGTIALVFQERLLSLGAWLKHNSEAIYDSSPWIYHNDSVNSNIWYTCVKDNNNAPSPQLREGFIISIYIIVLEQIESNTVKLKSVVDLLSSGEYGVQLLGHSTYLKWYPLNDLVNIILPSTYPEFPVLILVNKPSS